MAVPSNLTPTQIVTEALKWGGRTVPTSAQITDGLTLYMAAVKSDMHRVAPCHPSLLTQTTVAPDAHPVTGGAMRVKQVVSSRHGAKRPLGG